MGQLRDRRYQFTHDAHRDHSQLYFTWCREVPTLPAGSLMKLMKLAVFKKRLAQMKALRDTLKDDVDGFPVAASGIELGCVRRSLGLHFLENLVMRRKLKRCIIFSSGNGVLGAIYSRLMEPIQYIPQRMIEGEGVSGAKRKSSGGSACCSP